LDRTQSRPKSAIANSSLSISRQQYSNSRRQNSSCLVQFNQIFPRKLFKVHHLEDLKALLSILYKRETVYLLVSQASSRGGFRHSASNLTVAARPRTKLWNLNLRNTISFLADRPKIFPKRTRISARSDTLTCSLKTTFRALIKGNFILYNWQVAGGQHNPKFCHLRGYQSWYRKSGH
jgi:hypothetical protein